MKVLIACECSGVTRRAFRDAGHDAWSVDIKPSDDSSEFHMTADAAEVISYGWDLMIAHPPCTYLSNSGVRWLHEDVTRWPKLFEAAAFFKLFLDAPVKHIAIENPVMHKYGLQLIGRGPDFSFQPWQHGHGETKRTCFWLNNLPVLKPSKYHEGREQRVFNMDPSEDRAAMRSRTFEGVAAAMLKQWGNVK